MTPVTNTPMNNAATPAELSPSARGRMRLGAGLALFLVAPAWLGIASLVGAWHSIQWPAWYAWVASIVGVASWRVARCCGAARVRARKRPSGGGMT